MTSRPQLAEAETIFRRFFALPLRLQMEHYKIVHEYLAAEHGMSDAIPQDIAERLEALDIMRQVADHLGLPEGSSPPSTNFNAALRTLGVEGWSVRRVAQAFRESYLVARHVYEGGTPPPTVEQEAIRRAASGKERGRETALEALRMFDLWLEDQTQPVKEEQGSDEPAYNRWADGHNQRVTATGEGYYVPKSRTIRGTLRLTWPLAMAVARNELTLDDAKRQQDEARKMDEGPLHLLGRGAAAELLGIHPNELNRLRANGELPIAATVAGRSVWQRDQLEARVRNEAVPHHDPGWLQHELVDVPEAARRLGKKQNTLITTINQARWNAVPPPDGKAADAWYWMRDTFDAWLRAKAAARCRPGQ